MISLKKVLSTKLNLLIVESYFEYSQIYPSNFPAQLSAFLLFFLFYLTFY